MKKKVEIKEYNIPICRSCQGDNVETAVWFNHVDQIVTEDYGDAEDSNWCNDCGTHVDVYWRPAQIPMMVNDDDSKVIAAAKVTNIANIIVALKANAEKVQEEWL